MNAKRSTKTKRMSRRNFIGASAAVSVATVMDRSRIFAVGSDTIRALKRDWAINAPKLDLNPEKYQFGDLPERQVAIPGKTKLI